MNKVASFAGMFLVVLVVFPATADVVLRYTDNLDQSRVAETILLNRSFVRIESGVDGSDVVQFDIRSGTLTFIDRLQRTYAELPQYEIDRLSSSGRTPSLARLDALEQKSASWPAPEREALQNLRAHLGTAAKDQPALRDTGRREQIAGYPCTVMEVRWSDSRREQHCLGTDADLGLSPEEYAAIRQLMQITARLAEQPELGELSGLPVQSVRDDDGEHSELVLKQIEHVQLPDEHFTLPTGYKRRPIERL